ncbi:MAG: hypothetical protein QOG13_2504 [Sphingomonadales bacterium]|jgi:hypothetical protein|nr:hypothetical protein [Sphingomonadales bacterium]MEA3045115.1 hypothetical protein [Sphingomonadales bacterium]
MRELIDEFDVRTETGQVLRLFEFQDIINAGTKDDPHATIPGMKSIVTEDGREVNFIDENTFHIVSRGQDATRI